MATDSTARGRGAQPFPQATLATIARAAGVHISTASRALSSKESVRNSVAPATAETIRALATSLAYRPNRAGSTLRTGRSKILGVLVPRLTDIVLASIYEGIDNAAARSGYYTFVSNTEDDPVLQRERLENTLGRQVDGVLLGDARQGSDLYAELRRRRVPMVLFSRRVKGFVSVTIDDLLGGQLAADHLCSLGHRTIGVAGGREYASTGLERTTAFLDRCAERGVHIPPERVLYSGFDVQGGRTAAEQLLGLSPRPTAIFAVNDFAAIGVMGAVRDAGLLVGEDVAVVGYNDIPLAAELPVALTSVCTPRFEMGTIAVETMLRVLDGASVRSRRLTPTLRVRRSSQP